MRISSRSLSTFAGVALSLALSAMPSLAQSMGRLPTGVGLAAGVAQFDMAGTGTAPFGALRLERELTSWLVGDLALGLIRPDEQIALRRTYLVPEAQLQVQHTFGRVRPYVGLGMGLLKSLSGSPRTYAIFSGSSGARVAVIDALDVRGELRVTGQSATLAQWTLGLARRF